MRLKYLFLSILYLNVPLTLSSTPVKALLHTVKHAHTTAVSPIVSKFTGKIPLLTSTKSAIIATGLTIKPAMITGAVALGGIGFFSGLAMMSGNVPGSGEAGLMFGLGGAYMGASAGAFIGLAATPLYYRYWNRFFTQRVTKEFTKIVQNTASDLRKETLEYINSKPAEAITEKYLAYDEKSLNIFKELLKNTDKK